MMIFIVLMTACNPGVPKDKIIVYTNSGGEGRADWMTEKAKEAGFDIQVVQMGGNTLANRIIAEKNNPIADVTYGMSQMDWQKIKSEDGLLPYKPKWANEIDKSTPYLDKHYYFNPLVEQRIVQIFDKNQFNKKSTLNTISDLWENKQFHGKYAVPSSLGGLTDRTIIMSILAPYIDENDPKSELGVKPEGWKAIQKYIDNGYITPDGEDKIQNLVSNKVPIAYQFSSGLPGVEKEFKFNAGILKDKNGVPTTIESIGIMNKGKNHDYSKTKAFVDWFGSAKVQQEWSKEFGTYSTNKYARSDVSPSMQTIIDDTKPQNIKYDTVNKYIDQWVEKIELDYY